MDWPQLRVDSAIVHYVPTARDETDPELLLTDAEIDLDDALREYLREKITGRVGTQGLDVVVDRGAARDVPAAAAAILRDSNALVASSKTIATHLHTVQGKVNSSGLLAVARCRIGETPWLAIVKLERERGVRFAISEVEGRYVVDLELLRNLTLTDKTKVYKTAVLGIPKGGAPEDVFGLVADDQRTSATGSPVASFFLVDFLGCRPKELASETTLRFVRAANASINEDVSSPEKRGRYQVALLATMQDASTDIRPRSFAQKHLDEVDRPAFLRKIREVGIDPNRPFPKDTSRVKVAQFKMTFESGMVLVGDREALETRVELPDDAGDPAAANEGPPPVMLYDTVKTLLTGR